MSKNIFNSVQYPKVGTNTFDLSHDVKMSFKMGGLYPTFIMDCIPGDRVRVSTETLLRFAPLVSPVMHRVNVTTHFFFVPNRILWTNWEKWITGELEVEPPYMRVGHSFPATPEIKSWPEGSLADYFGLPTENENMADVKVSAFPFAAYWKIWDEYYKDQNLFSDDYEFLPLENGANLTYVNFGLQPPKSRAWMHDYFTAALPFAQKGDAVQLPIGDFSDVPIDFTNVGRQTGYVAGTDPFQTPDSTFNPRFEANTGRFESASGTDYNLDVSENHVAKTSLLTAEAADINTLRRAFRLQEWLERNARGGTRYIENIMAHFGVKSSDARLNRPEFLGGSYQKMVISEVLSTAETDVPVGQMAGHGISLGAGKEFTYYCEEHGWIIGLINVQPVTAYQQGINRMFLREDRLDYYWPTFAHIGEQEVKNKEVYVDDETYNEGTFGYVPRYAEYRYLNSRVAGEMRTSLSHWHLGRIFDNPPNLNISFVQANPSDRIFAVQDGSDHIYGHIFNNVKAIRKIPKFGTPSF